MSEDLDLLVSAAIAQIAPYEPGKPLEELARELGGAWPKEGAIKLASNENPLGPSPKAMAAAARALANVHRYPDGGSFYLRAALAERHGVSPRQIAVGQGSNELIDLLIQTFCESDEEVLAPACSFACYRLSAEAHRRPFRETPNGPGFAYDLDALAAAVTPRTKIVFLANPNNPTGVYATKARFERLLDALPARVILAVDEAYFEYARAADHPDAMSYLSARPRLVVLRTFSKIYGLAGLRVGYAVGQPELIDYLHRVRLAFNVGLVAQAAARAALDDGEHVERSRRSNATELERMASGLGALGWTVTPSQTNFLLAEVPADRDARAIYQALLERGVIVRPMGPYRLPRHLRITVGATAETSRLLETVAAVQREP
ncbi:MAG TPA: histidinol-phosphate transaminase [Polyangia bacterium]|jgi:histidinol-phosphate aminotransferase